MRGRWLAVALLLGAAPAHAEDVAPPARPVQAPEVTPTEADRTVHDLPQRDAIVDRVHALVEFGVGALSLPYKQLCIPTQKSCATSDYTLLGSLRYALRWAPQFSAGAGVSLGIKPLSDDADFQGPSGTIQRTHSRNYLMLSGQFRYYFYRRESFEAWAGVTGGLIVVSDRYELEDKGTAIINPQSTTLSARGPMAGIGAGADWSLSPAWAVGGWTSQMLWFLPDKAVCAPTNECSTISGNAFSLELGISLTYRTRL